MHEEEGPALRWCHVKPFSQRELWLMPCSHKAPPAEQRPMGTLTKEKLIVLLPSAGSLLSRAAGQRGLPTIKALVSKM